MFAGFLDGTPKSTSGATYFRAIFLVSLVLHMPLGGEEDIVRSLFFAAV